MVTDFRTRVVIQNRESQLYFQEADKWTPYLTQAADFVKIRAAHEFVQEHRLHGLDVVMIFGDEKYNIRIPTAP